MKRLISARLCGGSLRVLLMSRNGDNFFTNDTFDITLKDDMKAGHKIHKTSERKINAVEK